MKKSPFTNWLFKWLYFAINFFIAVGEVTKKIIFFPFRFILRLRLPKLNLRLPKMTKIKIPKLKLKLSKPELPEMPKLPKLPELPKLPKISFPHLPRIRLGRLNPFRLVFRLTKRIVRKLLTLRIRYFLLGSLITLIITSTYQSYLFVKALPSPNSIGKINYPLSTHIYDRNGTLLYEVFRDQNRTPVSLKDLPPYVAQATVAIEDKDFYRHNGIAIFSGILRAVRETVFNKNVQGGSTITQQLVKSALLSPERTIQRKLKEIFLALWTEQLFSKDQILEMYLNQVAYGGSSYGIQEAAKTYFGKNAKDLTLEQAAMLAGLPQAPSLYSPYSDPNLTKIRRNEVLKAMFSLHYIDEATYQKEIQGELGIVPLNTRILAPHFVFYVKSQLESLYGISQVEEGGLKVTTTLDENIQSEAEKILKEELDKVKPLNITNGAILVTRPSTGEILAMVGSEDYFNSPSGAFNVTLASRQPGSAIKPIMYSLALQKGFTAATILDDSPVVFTSPYGPPYAPENYDSRFHGKIPLRYALANSYNVPAVKTLNQIGVADFISHAQNMGITTWTDTQNYGLSLTLGGGDVTMTDMSEAFGVLANAGYKVPLNSFVKVEDSDNHTISRLQIFKVRELDSGIAYILSDILSDNFARQWAFGPYSFLEIPGYKVAVKTGTTNDKKDNWTIGYTPDFLVTVWVGNNDNSAMNQRLASGITGAAPIWNRMMSYLLKSYSNKSSWYPVPDDITSKTCYFGRTEYFIKGTEKNVSCSGSVFTTITPTPTPH